MGIFEETLSGWVICNPGRHGYEEKNRNTGTNMSSTQHWHNCSEMQLRWKQQQQTIHHYVYWYYSLWNIATITEWPHETIVHSKSIVCLFTLLNTKHKFISINTNITYVCIIFFCWYYDIYVCLLWTAYDESRHSTLSLSLYSLDKRTYVQIEATSD